MISLHELGSPSSPSDRLSPGDRRLHNAASYNSACLGNAPSVSMANAAFAAQLDPSYPVGIVAPPLAAGNAVNAAASHFILSGVGGTPRGGHRHHNGGAKNVDDDDDSDDDDEEDEEPLMMPAASGDDSRYVRFFSMRNLRVFLSFLTQLRESERDSVHPFHYVLAFIE